MQMCQQNKQYTYNQPETEYDSVNMRNSQETL